MFRKNGTMAHTLMAKLIRALELHYAVIQFVIPCYSFIIGASFFGCSNLLLVHTEFTSGWNIEETFLRLEW